MGPVIMIVGVVLMIVIHEGAHFVAAMSFGMKATEAFIGFGPKIWSTIRGETEYGVKAILLGGYVRIIGMNPFEEVDTADEYRTYRFAPFWKKAVVVLAGIVSHFVVALILLWIVGTAWGVIVVDASGFAVRTTIVTTVEGTTPDDFQTLPAVTDVPRDATASPALLAGMKQGDIIVAADDNPIETWEQFTAFVKANGDTEVAITVNRDGDRVVLFATLATIVVPRVVDGKIARDDDARFATERIGFFGIKTSAEREHVGPVRMIPVAFGQFWDSVVRSITGLWQLIIGFPALVVSLFGGKDEILKTVRPISPIGLVQLAGPLQTTLLLLAFVNIFVGVLNFVPMYPLDGGHFAVAAYEKITGREPNVQKLLPVAAAVFIFLVSLSLMGVYLDIFRPIQ
ncbi:MAG: site-2 protease family protein [Acidimicrobiia bacterium]|nr:site-2 protease family protein [Acidimicrobiia bacterium]